MKRQVLTVVVVVGLLLVVGCDSDEPQGADEAAEVVETDEEEVSDETESEAETDDEPEVVELNLPSMSEPKEGIITSAQPSEEDFEALANRGVKTVVTFRADGEEDFWNGAEKAEELGLEYFQIPVDSEEDVRKEDVERFGEVMAGVDGETLVHCGTSDRASGMLALHAHWHHDYERDEALELGRRAGLDDFTGAVEAAMDAK